MRIKIPESFGELRKATVIDHVSIGAGGIRLVPVAELDAAQRGYGDVASDTDWQPGWAVKATKSYAVTHSSLILRMMISLFTGPSTVLVFGRHS